MFDTFFLQQAIELAKKGSGCTSPNPVVGAVLVKNGKVIGTGYHKQAGKDHAEVVAIRDAQKKTNVDGAALYVTLEPCSHYGKTPPCVEAVVSAGIRTVYVGMRDPYKKVNGRGVNYLRSNGVKTHVLPSQRPVARQIRMLNQPFIKWATTGLPYVTLKAAVSLDGKIATHTKDSRWITGGEEREDARAERSLADAVLVGSGTVAADNPTLASHGRFAKKQLTRIILDPELSLSPNARVFRDQNVIVVTTKRAKPVRLQKFAQKNIRVKIFQSDRIPAKPLLTFLAEESIQHVFVEGGGGVHGSFLDAAMRRTGIVDRVIWYVAPVLIGGKEAVSSVGGVGVKTLAHAPRLQHVLYRQVGTGIKVSGYFHIY